MNLLVIHVATALVSLGHWSSESDERTHLGPSLECDHTQAKCFQAPERKSLDIPKTTTDFLHSHLTVLDSLSAFQWRIQNKNIQYLEAAREVQTWVLSP